MAAEGKTEELLSQKEAEVKELKEKLEKADGRVENAQAKIHEWEKEVGDTRAEKLEFADKLKGLVDEMAEDRKVTKQLQADLAKAQSERDELKKSGPPAVEAKPKKTVQEQIAAIETTLTDEDRSAMKAAIDTLDEDARSKVNQDDGAYLEFLNALRRKRPQAGPAYRWEKTPEKKAPKASDTDYDKLFDKQKKGDSYVPPGGANGAPRSRQPVQPKPVPQWMVG